HRCSTAAREAASLLRTCDASASRPRCRRPARFALPDVPAINDSDDAGVDRWFGGVKRKARFFAAHEKHELADPRATRIDRDQRAADRLTVWRQRLNDQQLDAGQVVVLAGRNDVADHSRYLHWIIGESGNRVIGRSDYPITRLPGYQIL